MKKKVISLLCAAAMMLALPAAAWAGQFDSPNGTSATSNETTLYVKGDVDPSGGHIVVEATNDHADNAAIPSGHYAASFSVYKVGEISFDSLDLTFNVPSKYAGAKGVLYVQGKDGNTSVEFTVSDNGIVSHSINDILPTTLTIVVDPDTATGDLANTGKDTSATSPQTGVDLTGLVAAAGVMLIAAGGVACTLRKKAVE